MVPTAWQDEALARDGVSREVPCSALKGETVPVSEVIDIFPCNLDSSLEGEEGRGTFSP